MWRNTLQLLDISNLGLPKSGQRLEKPRDGPAWTAWTEGRAIFRGNTVLAFKGIEAIPNRCALLLGHFLVVILNRDFQEREHSAQLGGRQQTRAGNSMITSMEPRVLHVNEADAVRDLATLLRRVQTGMEVVIERDAQPLAVIRAAAPARRTISQCIALAEAHEKETGQSPVPDPDFAADVGEIVRNRKPWDPPTWD